MSQKRLIRVLSAWLIIILELHLLLVGLVVDCQDNVLFISSSSISTVKTIISINHFTTRKKEMIFAVCWLFCLFYTKKGYKTIGTNGLHFSSSLLYQFGNNALINWQQSMGKSPKYLVTQP